MTSKQAIRITVLAACAAVCLAVAPASQPAAKPSVQDLHYVGDGSVRSAQAASSTRPHIGISIRRGHVVAYLCDGDPARRRVQRVGEWFIGRVRSGGRISLRSRRGARLRARVSRRSVTGSVRLSNGRVFSFQALRARGRGRFLWVVRPESGEQPPSSPAREGTPLLGWIRLANGRERGTFKRTSGDCENQASRLKFLANKQSSTGLTAAETEEYNRLQASYSSNCGGGAQ